MVPLARFEAASLCNLIAAYAPERMLQNNCVSHMQGIDIVTPAFGKLRRVAMVSLSLSLLHCRLRTHPP